MNYCRDKSAYGIRMPVVDCNEGTGRLLWQLIEPLEDVYSSLRYQMWLDTLPLNEHRRKFKKAMDVLRALRNANPPTQ